MAGASNFKFGRQLGFAKAHHKIARRKRVDVTLGNVWSKTKQTHSTIGLNDIRIKFEFHAQSSNLEKKTILHPYPKVMSYSNEAGEHFCKCLSFSQAI